jgi:hydroxymethylpyrimidine pyrophosphatase-like HAD family hydrolase
MRYTTLACDYDGTIAHDGVVSEETMKALKACAKSGRKLVLVTGRELPELLEVCKELREFHLVVAENGGLLYDPATEKTTSLGPVPSPEFVSTLQRRGVEPCTTGAVIVSTKQPHETTVLQAIRDLGLELQVIFNKGSVMVLPSGINKATGLSLALKEMKVSPNHVVAVGDAENDHALLESCAVGVAVANAVALLKAHADWVTDGRNGAGVQELIARLIKDDLADIHPKPRQTKTPVEVTAHKTV